MREMEDQEGEYEGTGFAQRFPPSADPTRKRLDFSSAAAASSSSSSSSSSRPSPPSSPTVTSQSAALSDSNVAVYGSYNDDDDEDKFVFQPMVRFVRFVAFHATLFSIERSSLLVFVSSRTKKRRCSMSGRIVRRFARLQLHGLSILAIPAHRQSALHLLAAASAAAAAAAARSTTLSQTMNWRVAIWTKRWLDRTLRLVRCAFLPSFVRSFV